MGLWEKVVSDQALMEAKKGRSKKDIVQKFPKQILKEKINEGWVVDKELKKSMQLKKRKPIDEQFEDEVWMLFFNLGFTSMNKDRFFEIQYDSNNIHAKRQIDVFAVDDETILVIECKVAEKTKRATFKETIEAIGGIKPNLLKSIQAIYHNRKIKFILATKNYILSEPDLTRLENFDIIHFGDDSLHYYRGLAKHLGSCARYQLLGYLFAGKKIPNIDGKVLAVEGRMGGHKYYSFSIEPEKLLKIGYVLHRNNANNDLMPTYQRLIKKSRLTAVRKFIENKGFFPNPIVINIKASRKDPQFDFSEKRIDSSNARIGILYLPQEYRSAYIIDGQHRLYGYANTEYSKTHTIPVLAFVNLTQEEQIKLFMEINENQKAVSKNLRLTLETDLLWTSRNYNNQRKALQLRIAQMLGEDKYSPLYNRIQIGEHEKSTICCITIDYIQKALTTCNFFTKFNKDNTIIKNGTIDSGKNDVTLKQFFPFIKNCFQFIYDELPEEWEKGENGMLTINLGIYGLIKIFNDIVDHLCSQKKISMKDISSDQFIEDVKTYLKPLVPFFFNITPKQRDYLKKQRGSSGMITYWRHLQQEIANEYSDFNPPGLNDWILSNRRIYNDDTKKMIDNISSFIKNDFKKKLSNKYGLDWFGMGLPKMVYDRVLKKATSYNYGKPIIEHQEPWDFITLNDCRDIAIKSGNWSEIFESNYAWIEEKKRKATKNAKTEWIEKIFKLQTNNLQQYSISEDEYNFVKNIFNWLNLNKPNTN